MLDADGVDAPEVLFPNPPGGTFFECGDVEFELDVVRAYNDALAEWYRASDRYVPLAVVPYLSSPEVIKRELERAAAAGHRGVNLMGQMPKGQPHITDPYWYPVLGCLSGLGATHPFSWLRGLECRLFGAQMERLFAAPGPFGADGDIGGDAGADRAAVHFLPGSRKNFPVW